MQYGRHIASLVVVMLFAGGVTGIVGGWFTAQNYNHFDISPELLEGIPPYPPEKQQRMESEAATADLLNSSLVVGFTGLVLGAAMGLATGWLRRSFATAALGLILVSFAGCAAGAAGGAASRLVWKALAPLDYDVTLQAMAAHATAWAILAAGVAICCGLLTPPRLKSMLHTVGISVTAGLLAGLLFPVVCAVAYPVAIADAPIPSPMYAQMLWSGLASGLIALAAGRTINNIEKSRSAAEAPAVDETPSAAADAS